MLLRWFLWQHTIHFMPAISGKSVIIVPVYSIFHWISALMREVHIHFHILRALKPWTPGTIQRKRIKMSRKAKGKKKQKKIKRKNKCHNNKTLERTKSVYICCVCVCETKRAKEDENSLMTRGVETRDKTPIQFCVSGVCMYGNFWWLSYHLFVLLLCICITMPN